MEKRIKLVSEIEELKDFKDYAVDTDGIVYSFKYNKKRVLKPSWKRKIGNIKYGKYVSLVNTYGNTRSITIARLVCLAFIPTDNTNRLIKHINGDVNDNRVLNLEWCYKLPDRKRKENTNKIKIDNFIIENDLLNKIKKVHQLSIIKGMNVPDTNEFLNKIVDTALDEYIMRYGLKRMMN